MAQWINYEGLIDLIRNHHHDGFTGLITGLTDSQHSFQIGFSRGDIILMSYRVIKGTRAVGKIAEIDRAKVTVHPTVKIPNIVSELPKTSSILQQLTVSSSFDDETVLSVAIPSNPTPEKRASQAKPVEGIAYDPDLNKKIEESAIHFFGPIGAMVCEEKMESFNAETTNIRTLLQEIALEVGANEPDTQAFYQSVISKS